MLQNLCWKAIGVILYFETELSIQSILEGDFLVRVKKMLTFLWIICGCVGQAGKYWLSWSRSS